MRVFEARPDRHSASTGAPGRRLFRIRCRARRGPRRDAGAGGLTTTTGAERDILVLQEHSLTASEQIGEWGVCSEEVGGGYGGDVVGEGEGVWAGVDEEQMVYAEVGQGAVHRL